MAYSRVKNSNAYRGQAGDINEGRRLKMRVLSAGGAALQIQLMAVTNHYEACVVISNCSIKARNLEF